VMPSLGLGAGDAAVLIDYIDRQGRAVRGTTGTSGEATATATSGAANLTPIVDSYLRIQRALNADTFGDSGADARRIAAEAGRLAGGGAIEAASGDLQKATNLEAARAAFGRLGDAIIVYAEESGATIGDEIKVAYCPMVRKYWLQKGERIQNPYYGRAMSDCGRVNATLPNLKK
jgi:hypothetical protein